MKWYLKAAEQGFIQAQNRLVALLSSSKVKQALKGEENLIRKASKWIYLKKAEQESPQGKLKIGEMFLNGDKVEQNSETAFNLVLEAAQTGLAEAQHKAGYMMTYGIGADPESVILVFMWLLNAAEQGFTPSIQLIKDLAEKDAYYRKLRERALEVRPQCREIWTKS